MRLWAQHWLDVCREMPLRGRRLLDRMGRDPAKQIHDFRRLMKVWRSLLKLAPPTLAEEAAALRGEIRRMRKGFSAARDAAVVNKTLQKLLPEERVASVAPMPDPAPASDEVDTLRTELDRHAARMDGWSIANEEGNFLLAAFRRTYRKARRAARRDPRRMSLKRLHAWRTNIIDLGYQLSFFQPADPARYKEQIETAERLRDELGEVVDLDMARRHLVEAGDDASLKKAYKRLDKQAGKRRRKAAGEIAALLGERPKAACAHLAGMVATHEPRRIRLA